MENVRLENYNKVYKAELDSWSDIEEKQGLSGIKNFITTSDAKLGEYIDYFSNGDDIESKLAFDKENLIGFVLYSLKKDEAHIEIIGTSPNFRGKGYSKKIMRLLEEELKNQGINKIFFEVNKNNKSALGAFSKIAKQNNKYSSENYEGMELI